MPPRSGIFSTALAGLSLVMLAACTTPATSTGNAPVAVKPLSENARTALQFEATARAAASEGRFDDAAKSYVLYLDTLAEDPARDPETFANGLTQLAGCYYRLKFFAQAASRYQEAIAFEATRLGPEHPDVEGLRSILAGVELRLGHPKEAERIQRDLLAAEYRRHGRGRREAATILFNLADALEAQGRTSESEACRLEAKDIRHKLCDEC
jgi:tetratricopeptide (TPR) repeat protein